MIFRDRQTGRHCIIIYISSSSSYHHPHHIIILIILIISVSVIFFYMQIQHQKCLSNCFFCIATSILWSVYNLHLPIHILKSSSCHWAISLQPLSMFWLNFMSPSLFIIRCMIYKMLFDRLKKKKDSFFRRSTTSRPARVWQDKLLLAGQYLWFCYNVAYFLCQ